VLTLRLFRGPRAIFLPLYGAVLGATGAFIYLTALAWGARSSLAMPIAAGQVLVAMLWGGLSFAPREQRRVGIFAGVMLIAGIGLRWFAIGALPLSRIYEIFVASQTVPRAAIVVMTWASRPAADGEGYEFSAGLSTLPSVIAMTIGLVAGLYCGLRAGLAMVVGVYLIIRGVRWFGYRYAGGVNGDTLGITQLLIELFVLFLFTCAACRW
jgi:cobalamin synthase